MRTIQREAVESIQKAGGYVQYDWQFKDGEPTENTGPPWPEWLVRLTGSDCFSHVTVVWCDSAAESGRVWRQLRDLNQLQELVFEGANISDQDLAAVEGKPSLLKLDISSTGVGDQGLAHLKGLSGLKDLLLEGTKVTDVGTAHRQGLTNLERLNLNETGVGDDGLVRLSNLNHLQELELRSTNVTDAGLARLERLRNLKDLDLTGTRISDAGLATPGGTDRTDGPAPLRDPDHRLWVGAPRRPCQSPDSIHQLARSHRGWSESPATGDSASKKGRGNPDGLDGGQGSGLSTTGP